MATRKNTDFRKIITAELARQKRNRYWLAQEVAGDVSQTALYAYLRGESSISADSVLVVLDALKIPIPTRAKR